jgi:putative protein-disulfide isomerase
MNSTHPATLHYVFDPLCGWCYAAAPLLRAAHDLPGLAMALHGGGMLTGSNRRHVTPQWRAHVLPHDQRIAALSGQPFGAAYFDGLLQDPDAVLDSAPPTTAVLAAEALGGRGLDLLERLQQAHYVEGRRIADTAVLAVLAAEIGLDPQAFAAQTAALAGAPTQEHIADSRQWLARLGGQGFPTLALAVGERLVPLDAAAWLGRPAAWRAELAGQMGLQMGQQMAQQTA